MKDITVSRELLRQVLVRLEIGGPEWERDNLITALRAALEQPSPIATLFGSLPVYETAPVQEQQPVAWGITCNGQFTGNLFGHREAA